MTESEIVNDPATSYWLKEQLSAASNRDIVDFLADAELLVAVLKARLEKQLGMVSRSPCTTDLVSELKRSVLHSPLITDDSSKVRFLKSLDDLDYLLLEFDSDIERMGFNDFINLFPRSECPSSLTDEEKAQWFKGYSRAEQHPYTVRHKSSVLRASEGALRSD